jgi:serine/threonine-protein kinase RsbW
MTTQTFSGNYQSLAKISEFVVKAAQQAGLNEHEVYQVDLAVDEACCNIIDHAYGGEDRGDFQCTVEVSDGMLTVTLKDRGRPFDPALVPEPRLDTPLEELKARGAGIFLMRRIMDELHYETSPETGNKLVLIKKGAKA